jgi:hypothetical protein
MMKVKETEPVQQFMITWEATVAPGDETVDRLDDVMAQLIECDEIIDPSVEFDAVARTAVFEVVVEAADVLEAVAKASTLLRAALHAALMCTPGWPDARRLMAALRGPSVDAYVDV